MVAACRPKVDQEEAAQILPAAVAQACQRMGRPAARSRSRRDDIIVARPDAHVVGSHLPTSTSSLNSVR